MHDRMTRLLSQDLSLVNPIAGSNMRRFALKVVFTSIILSMAVSAIILVMSQWFGLLPMPLIDALSYGVVMSWLVGGVVAFILSNVLFGAVSDLARSNAEFERLSKTDTLTGLLNRRAFNEAFEKVRDDAALAIFDVDRFKAINDNFGHGVGDMVIRKVASAIADTFGSIHTVARIGGEEFAVIVCGGTPAGRTTITELARLRVAKILIETERGQYSPTISVGVAEIDEHRSRNDVFAGADRALYAAKNAGRNRLCHEDDIGSLAIKDRRSKLLGKVS